MFAKGNSFKLVLGMAAAIICSMIAAACQSQMARNIEVDLLITKDFGNKVVLSKKESCTEGDTVMDLLARNTDLETTYGGGFVNSINGIESKMDFKRSDWFYYVNGVIASRGAADTSLKSGDEVWWDFHRWGSGSIVNSAVGSFPQPFASDQNVKIIYGEGMGKAALGLSEKLSDLFKMRTIVHSYKGSRPPGRCILLLSRDDFLGADWAPRLNSSKLRMLNSLIISSAEQFQSDSYDLFLVGDSNGVEKAIERLLKGEMRGYFAAGIGRGGETVRLNLEEVRD